MIFFKVFYFYFLYHQRKYRELLQATAFKESANAKKIGLIQLRYQTYCSFYTKNFYHAKLCLDILIEKKKMCSDDFVLLAFIHIRRNDKEKAINALCDALDLNHNNKNAKNTLNYIREQGRELSLGEDEFFDKLIPKEPFLIPVRQILVTLFILAAITLTSTAGYFGYKKTRAYLTLRKMSERSDIYKVVLPDYNPNILEVPHDSKNTYSYTEKQLKSLFELTKRLMVERQSVEAQININRIKLSNASEQVKFKVKILEDMIEVPDYATFQGSIDYDSYLKEKKVYQNIFVKWKGKIINNSVYKDRIVFDLVMGDDEKGIVTGIIPVLFDKPVITSNNEIVIVFGRILTDKQGREYIHGYNVIRNVR